MIVDCALFLHAIKQCNSVRNAETHITEIRIQTFVKLYKLNLQNVKALLTVQFSCSLQQDLSKLRNSK